MYTIDEIKEKAVPIAINHGVDSISLFGSYARGDQNENSDLDFLIEGGKVNSYFKIFDLINDLENKFKCHVDLITEGIEDRVFLGKIMKESKVLYERER